MKWGRTLGFGLCLLAIGFAIGFIRFTLAVKANGPNVLSKADAIVVLTGKTPRISEAFKLLANGHGKRLLISGVNKKISRAQLRRRFSKYDALFACCVDLDYTALNTVGNAIQSAQWVRTHKITSIILVTSNFHLPRSRLEFAHAMPEITLIGFGVIAQNIPVESWWNHPGTALLLFGEYSKYILAFGRIYALGPFRLFTKKWG